MRKIIIFAVTVLFSLLVSGQNSKIINSLYYQQISDEFEIISDTYGIFNFDANRLLDKLNISCYDWFVMIETGFPISVRDGLVGTTGIIPESFEKNGAVIVFYGTRLKMKADGEEAVPCLVWNEQVKNWEAMCCYLQFIEAFTVKPLSERTAFLLRREQMKKTEDEARRSSSEYLKKTWEQESGYWRQGACTENDGIGTYFYHSKDGKYQIVANYKNQQTLSMAIVKNLKRSNIQAIYGEINSKPVSAKEAKKIYQIALGRVQYCEAWIKAEAERCERDNRREELLQNFVPFWDVIGPNNR
jgi:hypothetical protein